MVFGIAADHGGFILREPVTLRLRALGHEIVDFGGLTYDATDDYPDMVTPLAEAIARNEVARGVAVCGSGVGASIVANKVPGVRASVCHDTYSAHQAVEHDDLNLLAVGARIIGPELALEIVQTFACARFLRVDRHVRRLAKINELERRACRTIESSSEK